MIQNKWKIAILNTGSTDNRKGQFNNVHERIKHLQAVNDVEVDAYLIRHYDSWAFRLLRNKKELNENISIIDGVKYNNLWVKHKLWDYILTYRLKRKDISCKSQLEKYVSLFKKFDLLSAHALPDMYLAYLVKQKYGIPFVNTWHGSDINIWPFVCKKGFETTKLLMVNADYNFFVSKRLQQTSDKIARTNNKSHLYTGPSNIFYKRSISDKQKLRKELNIQSKYLIGYIGNLVHEKNILCLPDIFRTVNVFVDGVYFIVVGDGKLEDELKKRMDKKGVKNVTYTGKVEPERIPSIMSALDILLLPSINEGMPRIALEALISGVHVVGSDVGGIPEAIGEENTFALNGDFVKNISNRIIEILINKEEPKELASEFSWDKAVEKELKVYAEILNKKR